MVTVEPEKPTIEIDTFTCCHCNKIVRVPVGVVNQAPFCIKCMARTCKSCCAVQSRTVEHMPFEKKLDLYEKGKLRLL